MTAAERSELAEIRAEMNNRFDRLDDANDALDGRLRAVETQVASAAAAEKTKREMSDRQDARDDRAGAVFWSRSERRLATWGIAVSLIIGLANLIFHGLPALFAIAWHLGAL